MHVDYASLKAIVTILEAQRFTGPDDIVLAIEPSTDGQTATLVATYHDCRDNGPPFIKEVLVNNGDVAWAVANDDMSADEAVRRRFRVAVNQ